VDEEHSSGVSGCGEERCGLTAYREAERERQVNALKEGAKNAWEPDARLAGFRDSRPPGS